MCVICYKPRGIKMPSDKTIETMFLRNPDGAGFMFYRGGSICWRKGFFTLHDFMKALRDEWFKTSDMVAMHFRIATSGGLDERFCHPFPVSPWYADLVATEGHAKAVFMHNGIIGAGTRDMSDTMLYVQKNVNTIRNIKSAPCRRQIAQDTAGSRTLTFTSDCRAYRTGNWIHDGGLYFSNYSYNNRLNRTTGTPREPRNLTARIWARI